MSRPVEIAIALVSALNSEFPGEFVAERSWIPGKDLKDLGQLAVTVTPRAGTATAVTRTSKTDDVIVDIGIQKKLGADLDGEADELAGLAEDIFDWLWSERPALSGAKFIEAQHDPYVVAEHLQQLRVFTSLITVTYRA